MLLQGVGVVGPDEVEACVGSVVGYLEQALARSLVAECRGLGVGDAEVVRRLELAKVLFGWE